jgi:hypothetical protein
MRFFASFFAAAMVGIAFAYFNYKFSRFNFIDFSQAVLYSQSEIFAPQDEAYITLIFSSSQESASAIAKRINNRRNLTILAIDLAQNRESCDDFSGAKSRVICLTAGINTLLSYVRRFNIDHSPSAFVIERQKNSLYKQATLVEKF